mmetsp:Transcript_13966/g.39909  ORF Transcript_13966/g.39909 Transcript_13966/m.39909 type:complete len:455 (+) Transcript_13966:1183-2547(+)
MAPRQGLVGDAAARGVPPRLDPGPGPGLGGENVEDRDPVVRVALLEVQEDRPVPIRVPEGTVDPDVLAVPHRHGLHELLHIGGLRVAQSACVPAELQVVLPLWHGLLKLVRVHAHHIGEREEAMFRHPRHAEALAGAVAAAGVHEPRHRLGLSAQHHRAHDGVLPTLPRLSVAAVVAEVQLFTHLLEAPGVESCPAAMVRIRVVRGLRKVVIIRKLVVLVELLHLENMKHAAEQHAVPTGDALLEDVCRGDDPIVVPVKGLEDLMNLALGQLEAQEVQAEALEGAELQDELPREFCALGPGRCHHRVDGAAELARGGQVVEAAGCELLRDAGGLVQARQALQELSVPRPERAGVARRSAAVRHALVLPAGGPGSIRGHGLAAVADALRRDGATADVEYGVDQRPAPVLQGPPRPGARKGAQQAFLHGPPTVAHGRAAMPKPKYARGAGSGGKAP